MTHWLDNPELLISGGIVLGQLTGANISTPLVQDFLDAESATYANRDLYISIHQYSTIPPTDVATEYALMTGAANHPVTPMLTLLGEGNFTFPDPGWPPGGCAAFTNGSMDSTIQAWCNLLNTLPGPFIGRLWREFNVTLFPWSANGAANGGVNETPASYIAGWRYVANYLHAHCPNIRLVWCPNLPSGYTLSSLTAWYPGDDVVDWVGADGYANSPSYRAPATIFQIWHDGFNKVSGTFTRKPLMICETQVQKTDPNRPADYARYTPAFSGSLKTGLYALCFWNGATNGTYRITDTGSIAGSVAAYQAMVGAAPFLGTPQTQTPYHLGTIGAGLVIS